MQGQLCICHGLCEVGSGLAAGQVRGWPGLV